MPHNPGSILWILDYFPRPHDMTAGAWALQSVYGLRRKGLDIVVLAPTPWIPRALAWNAFLRNWAAVPEKFELYGIPVYYPKCLHYPHRLVTLGLYNHLPYFDSGLVWRSCKKTAEEIFRRYRISAVHANFIFPAGYLGREIKKRYQVPLIVHERSLTRLTEARDHQRRRHIYADVLRSADAVITVNNRMAKMIQGIAADGTVVKVIGDGGDPVGPQTITHEKKSGDVISSAGFADPAAKFNGIRPARYDKKKVVLCVGSFMERKGQEYVVRAVERIRKDVPEVHCIFIGQGLRLNRIRRLIKNLGLQDVVELWGQRSHYEVLSTMSWCDVFTLPSWQEPGGTVYGEAMAFSKPVVACEGEGIADVMKNGVEGMLVRPRDVDSLSQALRTLLNHPDEAARMGTNAAKLAARKLSYDSVASQILRVYERVIPR